MADVEELLRLQNRFMVGFDLALGSGALLAPEEFENLVTFVRDGLLDERARKQNLCTLVPERVALDSRWLAHQARRR